MQNPHIHTSVTAHTRVIFILSLIGFIMAIYVLQSFIRQAPIVCVNTGCEIVRKHPASYIAGIPVPAFGLVGYTILAISMFLRTLVISPRLSKTFLMVALGVSVFGVLFVSWFTYTELFVIKGICTWCALSALNMVLILFLTLSLAHRQRSDV